VNDHIAKEMQQTYDHYFLSHGYRRRYPEPNAATLGYVLKHGAHGASRILDFGCGNGRYAMALLAQTSAHLTAYDISAASLLEFEDTLKQTPYRERVTLVHGEMAALAAPAGYDVVLMLFGVLSHLGDRASRLHTLRELRGQMRADSRLIVSVPSIYRRRPWELLRYGLERRLGLAQPPQDEPGNIYFTRHIQGQSLRFFYHLYTVDDLRQELHAAGFALSDWQAESMLPEWWITQSTTLRGIDRVLSARLPAALGYGMRAVAIPL